MYGIKLRNGTRATENIGNGRETAAAAATMKGKIAKKSIGEIAEENCANPNFLLSIPALTKQR